MKKSPQQGVICPHCHSAQSEPVGVISTNCKSCGKYFKIDQKTQQRAAVRTPKATREVFCVRCGAPNLVSSTALSTQCVRCLHYLELGNKVIRGVQTGKLYAYDDVLFEAGCSFKGMEVTGHRLEIRGKVFSKMRATAEIIAQPGSQLSGELHAPEIRVERGAKVKVQSIDCSRLRVSGEVEVSGRLAAEDIVLTDGAVFTGELHMPHAKIQIDSGVSTSMESVTCRELSVAGRMTLGTSLVAESVLVTHSGVLTSGRICTGRLEVNAGGFLQGRLEKYVPAPEPVKDDANEADDSAVESGSKAAPSP